MDEQIDARLRLLPEPLTFLNGTTVTTAADWDARRAELRGLFENEMYGQRPSDPQDLSWELLVHNRNAAGGTATVRKIRVTTAGPDCQFDLLVITPNRSARPVPCFLGANVEGNRALVSDDGMTLEPDRADADWSIGTTIDAGYALATLYYGDVVPDEPDTGVERLNAFAREDSSVRPGAVITWAWALSRALDVLTSLGEVDSERVIAFGHSRLGKVALVATAFDDRFSAVIANQSGCCGAAPSRMSAALSRIGENGRPSAETVEWITRAFPHWFSPALAETADHVTDLSVDQHELVALCAPRPVLLSNAMDDTWSDPSGQFAMLKAADPVYRLLTGDGLRVDEQPAIGDVVTGPLTYSMRTGGHSVMLEDWENWRRFADSLFQD
jgi:hypothetical protein